jgi:peptidoglycan-associated lipoprotein
MIKSRMLRLALVGVAVSAMAACARQAETPGPITDNGGTQQTGNNTTYPDRPVTGGEMGAARPGSAEEFANTIGDRVYFDLDSYTIRPEAYPRLNQQAAWLRQYPAVTIRIEGNADERGTAEYNLALGARRAEAVRTYLVQQGVPASRIDTISFGKERPIAQGSSEESWARNRNAHTAIVSGAR